MVYSGLEAGGHTARLVVCCQMIYSLSVYLHDSRLTLGGFNFIIAL